LAAEGEGLAVGDGGDGFETEGFGDIGAIGGGDDGDGFVEVLEGFGVGVVGKALGEQDEVDVVGDDDGMRCELASRSQEFASNQVSFMVFLKTKTTLSTVTNDVRSRYAF
jgi:hypothetical protein